MQWFFGKCSGSGLVGVASLYGEDGSDSRGNSSMD